MDAMTTKGSPHNENPAISDIDYNGTYKPQVYICRCANNAVCNQYAVWSPFGWAELYKGKLIHS